MREDSTEVQLLPFWEAKATEAWSRAETAERKLRNWRRVAFIQACFLFGFFAGKVILWLT